jgi:hypothetical protein
LSETVDLLLRGVRLPDRAQPPDIAIVGERIAAIDGAARSARSPSCHTSRPSRRLSRNSLPANGAGAVMASRG